MTNKERAEIQNSLKLSLLKYETELANYGSSGQPVNANYKAWLQARVRDCRKGVIKYSVQKGSR